MNDKNQAAIDHVASVSKNPHAALIVKQLITGWPVMIKEKGKIIDNPFELKNYEYELIEPKPAKPAYRVYKRNNDITTYTQDRYVSGNTSHVHDINDVEFISDWIEYDQPKKWPTPLVERIAAIDLAASQWILDNWDELSTDKYNFKGRYSRYSDKLKTMFSWAYSDIDNNTWAEISKKLGEY